MQQLKIRRRTGLATAAARHAWEVLGFTTQPSDGLTISAMFGGALRCAVKVLAR